MPASAKEWSSNPFVATQKNNKVYGRGSTDMKGFIAVRSLSSINRDTTKVNGVEGANRVLV